jgi:hypothetical protein
VNERLPENWLYVFDRSLDKPLPTKELIHTVSKFGYGFWLFHLANVSLLDKDNKN